MRIYSFTMSSFQYKMYILLLCFGASLMNSMAELSSRQVSVQIKKISSNEPRELNLLEGMAKTRKRRYSSAIQHRYIEDRSNPFAGIFRRPRPLNFLRRRTRPAERFDALPPFQRRARPSGDELRSLIRQPAMLNSQPVLSSDPVYIFRTFIVPQIILERPSLQNIELESAAQIPAHTVTSRTRYNFFFSALDQIGPERKEKVRCNVNVFKEANTIDFAIALQGLTCERIGIKPGTKGAPFHHQTQTEQPKTGDWPSINKYHQESEEQEIEQIFKRHIIPKIQTARPSLEEIRLNRYTRIPLSIPIRGNPGGAFSSHVHKAEYRFAFSALDLLDKKKSGSRKEVVLCKVNARQSSANPESFSIHRLTCEQLVWPGRATSRWPYYQQQKH